MSNVTPTVQPPAQPPGLTVEVVEVKPGNRSALRSDIAGFLGRTRRGPLRVGAGAKPCRVRVQGQRGFNSLYSPTMQSGASTPYAINGYFQNEGQIAHVIRLGGPASQGASAVWELSSPNQLLGSALDGGFRFSQYTFHASSPGTWANKAQITLSYSRQGVTGKPSIDVVTNAPGELPETIRGIQPCTLVDQINQTSLLMRVRQVEGASLPQETGLSVLSTTFPLSLDGGTDDNPTPQTYHDAIQSMGDEPEVALLVMPDLYDDITDATDRLDILASAVALADSKLDRLVLVDVPPLLSASQDIITWVAELQNACIAASILKDQDTARAAAVYHPWLWVPDPLGTTPEESRLLIAPSGHVAGLISRLDRQRGAHYTPANAPVLQAFDVARAYRPSERAVLNDAGVDLIRCFPNQGLLVWGGRTLGTEPGTLYVAHRRLLHRLVRAIRAVAEPLVFDVNGPELWLTLVRAITTVLLQVYRAGGLAGATPAQAFQVQCDDQTNPSDAVDAGRVVCLVSVAPAVPMEFITLKVSLDTNGRLDVLK